MGAGRRDRRRPVSTHSRPKAAGKDLALQESKTFVSTHSRPKAAGPRCRARYPRPAVSTHSRPKAAGCPTTVPRASISSFNTQPPEGGWHDGQPAGGGKQSFNTQPPEGGWSLSQKPCSIRFRSPDFARLPRKARTRV